MCVRIEEIVRAQMAATTTTRGMVDIPLQQCTLVMLKSENFSYR